MKFALFTGIAWLDNMLELIVFLLIFGFVIFLAYWTARFVGTYQSNVLNERSNIRIIETYRIANNKYIQIAKISNKYVALGICKDTITVLTELKEEDIIDVSAIPMKKLDFKDILAKVRKDTDEEDIFPQNKK